MGESGTKRAITGILITALQNYVLMSLLGKPPEISKWGVSNQLNTNIGNDLIPFPGIRRNVTPLTQVFYTHTDTHAQ